MVEFDEIFLTGTTTQIITVSSVHQEGKKIFEPKKNNITARLQQEFIKITRGN